MENKTQENTNVTPSGVEYYSDSNGTGALSSIVFVLIAIIVMALIAHFVN